MATTFEAGLIADEAAREAMMTAPPAPSLLPVFRGQQMTEAFEAYRELQRALDAGMPDQLMNIRGRMFRKKGYWRAIATAFNLNVACVKEEVTETGWLVVYRATTPSGRFIDGDGACENDEKSDGQDTEHNVRSHAHTRAFNRAVSNLVGFGEVSAEEMRHERASTPATSAELTPPADARRHPSEPNGGGTSATLPPGTHAGSLIRKVEETLMTSGKRQGQPKWFVHFEDGIKASTIDKLMADRARVFKETGTRVVALFKDTDWGKDLISLAEVVPF
jgi:hypothetical protein